MAKGMEGIISPVAVDPIDETVDTEPTDKSEEYKKEEEFFRENEGGVTEQDKIVASIEANLSPTSGILSRRITTFTIL
jgi:hypothetical protein